MEQDENGQYAQKLKDFSISEADPGTIPWLFAKTEMPLFFLDLNRILSSNAAREWFSRERKMRSIGAGYSYDNAYEYFKSVILPDHFDAIIFVDSTTAARPNRLTRERFQ